METQSSRGSTTQHETHSNQSPELTFRLRVSYIGSFLISFQNIIHREQIIKDVLVRLGIQGFINFAMLSIAQTIPKLQQYYQQFKL